MSLTFNQLQNQVNALACETTGGDRYAVKRDICNLINKIFAENEITCAYAECGYGGTENYVKIYVRDENGINYGKGYWPVRVDFKTERTLTPSKYYYHKNIATYKLKSISIFAQADVENWAKEAIEEQRKSLEKAASELKELADYIDNNPDFIRMYKLAKEKHYKLDDAHRKLFW